MHPSAARMLKRSFAQMAAPAGARALAAATAPAAVFSAAAPAAATSALRGAAVAAISAGRATARLSPWWLAPRAAGNCAYSTAVSVAGAASDGSVGHDDGNQDNSHGEHHRITSSGTTSYAKSKLAAHAPSPVSKFKYAARPPQLDASVSAGASTTNGTSTTTANEADASAPIWDNPIPHPVYDLDAIAHIEKTHHEPLKAHEKAALLAVKALRGGFDVLSGYRGPGGGMTERDWLHRCLFLETVAGVPGMVAGMTRHLRSLRAMRRDYGWIHTLLEEAENERMHLLIFMNMKQPGWAFRLLVLGAQGVFFNAFFLAYLASPRTCHRFVGYLEEEAVKTYTALLQDIEDGHVDAWKNTQAPLIARNYYKLPESAQVVDMLKCIRADEANHRDVNHTFAGLDQRTGVNPFVHGH